MPGSIVKKIAVYFLTRSCFSVLWFLVLSFCPRIFSSERCFLITLAGYPLSFSSNLKFLMFSSNVDLAEFFYDVLAPLLS